MKKVKLLVVCIFLSLATFASSRCPVCGNDDWRLQYQHNPVIHGYLSFKKWFESTSFSFDFCC
jgi:hypothetical protein